MHEFIFYFKNEKHIVNFQDVDPKTTLNSYLRNHMHQTGTKKMCLEGGCGTCIVAVQKRDPHTGKQEVLAVNSCLVSIFSCYGWNIFSVEGIGTQDKPHMIQKVLADFNGTQCGYCSPGMVMNMFALAESGSPTMKEVENSFGGNICRCTGYRPILSAFKSICKDSCPETLGTIPDIEDLKNCPKMCTKQLVMPPLQPLFYKLEKSAWMKVYKFDDLIKAVRNFHVENKQTTYKLIAGNTGRGVYRNPPDVDIYVDIHNVDQLTSFQCNESELKLGANVTLTNAMQIFEEVADKYKHFGYLKMMLQHIDLIANVPVRNIGTLGGNLMMKHEHNDFPSDIYLIFESADVRFEIVDINMKVYVETALNFLNIDMSDKILKTLIFQSYGDQFKFDSFKIMPRAQNAHALVNAGFLFEFKENTVQSSRIVYGNINPKFVRASLTEQFLIGKNLFDNEVMQEAFKILSSELRPDYVICEPTPEFRKQLAISLFYKCILRLAPDTLIDPKNISGRIKYDRPVSMGSQDYETKESLYPLTMAIPKIEALAQTTGEAEYISDMPDLPNQLFATFVLSKAPPYYSIENIDTSKALKLKDVVAFFDKNDIPGRNTFTPREAGCVAGDEEVFCSGVIQYFNQPVGVIVAKSQELADLASSLVEVTYKPSNTKPLLAIRDIIKAGAREKIIPDRNIEPKHRGSDVKHIASGTFDVSWQYHYHMETHCSSVVPTEDSLDIFPASQWIDLSQTAASIALNIPSNKINVSVKRLGGGFGGKISRSSLVSTACAIASHKLKKPVKMWLTLEDNMRCIGKRYPVAGDYEVAVNDDGIIQYLDASVYYDYSTGGNEPVMFLVLEIFEAQYNPDIVKMKAFTTKSDMHAACYCRSPGSAEAIAYLENIIEHVAYEANIDPLELKLKNIKDENMKKLILEHKEWADIDKRKKAVEEYNKQNRWRKRGLAVSPMIFPFNLYLQYNAFISIYHADGSVAIAHGGVEIGQGINTKAAQVCAYKFGIPLSKVTVKPSNSLTNPNNPATGASITSENVCLAILKASDVLLNRLKPFKQKMPKATWEEIIKAAHEENVDLTATAISSRFETNIGPYNVYGVCSTEIELDVLTGQYQLLRVDLMEDVGESMSPIIDIGQIEGAFVMGLGYFLTEVCVVSENVQILSDRTWNYKPPGAKDIPLDFRVKIPKNNPNPFGVLKSKATGEPAFCLAVSAPLAIRQAIASVRESIDGNTPKWCPIDGPSTVEQTFISCLHNFKRYKL